jgi:hypothetical protein
MWIQRGISVARKRNQPDTPAPPNRIAAVPSGLKVVGRREYKNVIRHWTEDTTRIFWRTIEIAIWIREDHEVFSGSWDLGTAWLAFKGILKEWKADVRYFESERCLKVERQMKDFLIARGA